MSATSGRRCNGPYPCIYRQHLEQFMKAVGGLVDWRLVFMRFNAASGEALGACLSR